MNETWRFQSYFSTEFADRLLSIYSLLLILIGTPCNLICCLIYFRKSNRRNSIKTIFGYLAVLDTIVLYTFNLNYVVREFHTRHRYVSNGTLTNNVENEKRWLIVKINLEEHSLFICRFLSYLGEKKYFESVNERNSIFFSAFSTLQTSSWILTLGSLNRYFLIHKCSKFNTICKRDNTLILCFAISLMIFLNNIHIVWMNGYRSPSGDVVCYQNENYPSYMLWYQRIHLCLYSALPSAILLVFNSLLMRTIFASKNRLKNHQRSTNKIDGSSRRTRRFSSNRHSRKLTLSLIILTLSYFILTFPSTVIFSFFRSSIEPVQLRRTVSLFFTNLSTTTHAIRFLIYFFCSTDFRTDFYRLCRRKRQFDRDQRTTSARRQEPQQQFNERSLSKKTMRRPRSSSQ